MRRAATKLPAFMSPLREPVYRALWTATLLCYFGTWMQSVAAVWLMASIAPTVDFVAWVQAANSLAPLLFTVIAGALVDRFDQRLMLIVAQATVLSMSACFAVFTHLSLMTPWLVLALTFLLDSGSALRYPAYQTTVNRLLPRAEIPRALVLSSIGWNVARALGPGLGGLVIAAFGVKTAFILNAAFNLPIIAILVSWRRRAAAESRAASSANILVEIAGGFAHVRETPVIRNTLVRCFVFALFASALWSLVAVVAKHALGGGPEVFGALLGALGVGALFGAGALDWMRRNWELRRIFFFATSAFIPGVLALAVIEEPLVLLAILAVAGLGWMTAMSTFSAVVQLAAARAFVGRAVSIYYFALFSGFAIGSWVWGLIAEGVSVNAALFIAASGLAGSLLLYGKSSGLGRLPAPPVS
jgi:MFS family permease